jgi:hypothetical protein
LNQAQALIACLVVFAFRGDGRIFRLQGSLRLLEKQTLVHEELDELVLVTEAEDLEVLDVLVSV